ncbi:hypothetical protein GCM10009097_27290 [Pigmentiphaga daeguensis]|uniref:Mutator family transposase n=1 Tax=Pigmentiphaga daeguensis TaxID=414049 RepID=A0ABN1BZF3_9BURK
MPRKPKTPLANLNHHLGYSVGAAKPATVTNQRNGKGAKTVLPPKHERRFTGFDDKIVAMYTRGMTVRENPGLSARTIRHRGVAQVHQFGHGRSRGRGDGLAGPATGIHVPRRVLRRTARGVADILIAVTDGLKDTPEALAACFRRPPCRPVSST